MRISVFGLGYVGAVSGACLAELGHDVVGVDVDAFKVDTLNSGESPIVEELISELVRETVTSGRLRATTDVARAVADTDLSLVCVGTPSAHSGELDTTYVRRVCEQIGAALRNKSAYHLVVIRSTVLPGTTEDLAAPILASASGKRLGEDIGLSFHPEFLREGSSVKDFRNPPKIVIGTADSRAADMVRSMYKGIEAPAFVTSIRVAETVKYADNAFHALKVVFGNEVGALCKAMGVDSHEVMRVFCEDRKLNISPAYLMPGFAYGGSCLPKDLRALLHLANKYMVDLPVLSAIQPSNDKHLARALNIVLNQESRNVALLGLSFKPGTDDLRESPLVELVERLIGKGFAVRIYDEHVSLSRLRGGNKAYIEQKLPHISQLLDSDLDAVLRASGVVIIGAPNERFKKTLEDRYPEKVVVDLVRMYRDTPPPFPHYRGICW